MIIVIGRDGNARMAVTEDARPYLALSTSVEVKRASHVRPVDPVLKVVFKLLRRAFGDKGRVSDFTRGWRVDWEADMAPMGGPVLGPFNDRASALTAEERWLEENYFKVRCMALEIGEEAFIWPVQK